MSVDPTKTQFAAPAFNIDKIAAYSLQLDSSPASVPQNISYSIPGSGSSTPTYTLKTIANPYGHKCLTNLSWSVDSASFYDQDDTLFYYNATFQQMLPQMSVQCGCDDSTIYFFFSSSYTSTQTVTVQFAIDSIS